jgi:hypothetical protein
LAAQNAACVVVPEIIEDVGVAVVPPGFTVLLELVTVVHTLFEHVVVVLPVDVVLLVAVPVVVVEDVDVGVTVVVVAHLYLMTVPFKVPEQVPSGSAFGSATTAISASVQLAPLNVGDEYHAWDTPAASVARISCCALTTHPSEQNAVGAAPSAGIVTSNGLPPKDEPTLLSNDPALPAHKFVLSRWCNWLPSSSAPW